LKQAVYDYPGLVQRYLEAEAYPDSIAAGYLERVAKTAEKAHPLIELLDMVYHQNLPGAFAGLASHIPEAGDYTYAYTRIGIRLFDEFIKKGQADMALATLDLLAWNTSEETLPRK